MTVYANLKFSLKLEKFGFQLYVDEGFRGFIGCLEALDSQGFTWLAGRIGLSRLAGFTGCVLVGFRIGVSYVQGLGILGFRCEGLWGMGVVGLRISGLTLCFGSGV